MFMQPKQTVLLAKLRPLQSIFLLSLCVSPQIYLKWDTFICAVVLLRFQMYNKEEFVNLAVKDNQEEWFIYILWNTETEEI